VATSQLPASYRQRAVHPQAVSGRPTGSGEPGWTLVLPLKGGPGAKSRLGGGPVLARAIAEDCLEAVLACSAVIRVLVVTADSETAQRARQAGAETVPESRPGAGLVAAVLDGVAAADGAGGPVGVLLADLPALRPVDLAAGLATMDGALARHPRAPMAALPDAEGSGTVLLGARTGSDLDPAFGPGSMAEHLRRGAVAVMLESPRLRRDVDTADDLCAALALGAGPRTTALTADLPSAC
jgi:2-phospho-L-lactate guanylyltransferase